MMPPSTPPTFRRQNWGTEALLEGCTHGRGCISSRGEVWGSRQQLWGMVGWNKGAEGHPGETEGAVGNLWAETLGILACCEAGPQVFRGWCGAEVAMWGHGVGQREMGGLM